MGNKFLRDSNMDKLLSQDPEHRDPPVSAGPSLLSKMAKTDHTKKLRNIFG